MNTTEKDYRGFSPLATIVAIAAGLAALALGGVRIVLPLSKIGDVIRDAPWWAWIGLVPLGLVLSFALQCGFFVALAYFDEKTSGFFHRFAHEIDEKDPKKWRFRFKVTLLLASLFAGCWALREIIVTT